MISGIVVERRAGRTDDPHWIRILDHTSDGDPTRLPPRRPWIERMPADIASAWMQVAGQAIAETCGLQDADHGEMRLPDRPTSTQADELSLDQPRSRSTAGPQGIQPGSRAAKTIPKSNWIHTCTERVSRGSSRRSRSLTH